MLNIVLCDDHVITLNKLSKMLESIFIEKNINATVALKAKTANEVIDFIKYNKVDVLILDIDLKSTMSGIELGQFIRNNNKSVYIIYTTGHIEYVMIAYKVKTFDFLPKPIVKERLEDTVLRLIDDMKTSPKQYIKIGSSRTFVNQEDINFIKRDGMKVVFYTNNRQYETYSSFSKLQTLLPDNFIRCHKSYIANINNIIDIQTSNNTILFNNDEKCDIGPKYKTNLMEVIKNHGISTNDFDCAYNAK